MTRENAKKIANINHTNFPFQTKHRIPSFKMSSERRSSRSRKGNSAREQALDRLRKYVKTGEKVEYVDKEEEDIYDYVEEGEYEQLVSERQQDDFIVDDDGTGYQDDGREIFDQELDEKPAAGKGKAKGKAKEAEKPKNVKKITSMFSAGTSLKKKEKPKNVTLKDDEFLDDILNSVMSDESSSVPARRGVTTVKTPKLMKKHAPRRLQEEKKMMIKRKPLKAIGKKNVFKVDIDEMDIKEEIDDTPSEPKKQVKRSIEQKKQVENEMDIDMEPIDLDDIDNLPDENMDDVVVKKEETSMIDEDEEGIDDAELMNSMIKEEDEEPQQPEKANKKMFSMFDEKKEAIVPVACDTSSFPTVKVDDQEVVRLFWLDAYEDKVNQPGTVFLFGRIWSDVSKCYTSCCVSVTNIKRELYVLPRKNKLQKDGTESEEPVKFNDVYQEFDNTVANKYRIMEYKCRKVTKKYAFDLPDVPSESDYLQVIYSATQPQLPSDCKGQTFCKIFGTNTSSLELLLLNCKMLGPSWIDLKFPQKPKNPLSWCKFEIVIDQPEFLSVTKENIPPPPLNVLSLSIISTTHPKTHSHEIISVTGLCQPAVHLDKGAPENCFQHGFCLVTKPSDQMLPYDFQTTVQKTGANMQIFTSERSMLGLLLAKVQTIDPDVIVGHDIQGFDFDVLLQRLKINKVPYWSKIGRLKRTYFPGSGPNKKFSSNADKTVAVGRLVVDIKVSGKELIRCKSYDLSELISVVLRQTREGYLTEDIPGKILKTSTLLQMVNDKRMDAMYALQVMYELNILPLAFQITGICGNIMSRTLLGGRSERNEYLLLHAFYEKNYILPDKSFGQKNKTPVNDEGEGETTKKGAKGKKKPAYAGGLVLEPKKGFYDKYILLLDFNSLYPSIIQEYNICFTTVKNKDNEEELPDVPSPDLEAGILPTEIKRLVERRKQVKNLLKTAPVGSDLYIQYDIRQKALKLTANSMYGCLGFTFSRFYAKPLAALVTGKGREILMKTKDLATALGLDVIYGDTDSIMINTNSVDFKEVRKIGSKVKSEVNKLYRLVEIEIDGIYKCMLLLKKKKYAAVLADVKPDGTIEERIEMKGLDIVRRDWSDLAKDAGNYVLSQVLSSGSRETILENIHDYLRTIREMLQNGKIEMGKFEINKSLSKNPDEYPDKKSQPHVSVAARLMSQGRHISVGDTISYVICEDGSNLPAPQRSYHLDELAKNTNLKIDNHYYLANQIHPVVSRLCDPIEGTDPSILASCLGLDPTAYKTKTVKEESEEDQIKALMSKEERFKNVDRFYVECNSAKCSLYKQSVEFKGAFDTKVDPLSCPTCHVTYNIKHLLNSVKLFAREKVRKYYVCWVTCDDPTCGYTTRQANVQYLRGKLYCQKCKKGNIHPQYTSGELYNQLFYIAHILDANASLNEEIKKIRNKDARWEFLGRESVNILSQSAYAVVNLAKLFIF